MAAERIPSHLVPSLFPNVYTRCPVGSVLLLAEKRSNDATSLLLAVRFVRKDTSDTGPGCSVINFPACEIIADSDTFCATK